VPEQTSRRPRRPPAASPRPAPDTLARRLPRPGLPELVLALLVAVAAAWQSVLALEVRGPWLLPDEAAYALLARGFWEHGDLAVLGGPTRLYSAAYPVLAGVPLELFGTGTGGDVLRVLQVVALCSTAVIVYAWARSLVRPAWALAGALLTLLLPGFAYAGTITAETLLVPLATLAAWQAARTLERPARANQALLLAALGACLAVRLEANVVAVAFFVAAAVRGRLRALVPTWAVLGGIGIWIVATGPPLRSMGGYAPAPDASFVRAVELVAEHAGALLLVCGIVPLCAVVLLAVSRANEAAVAGTVALALSIAAVALVEVGVFAALHAGRLLERELLFALPPLLVGFAAWLGRGAPRPRVATFAIAAAAFTALVALPIGRLATIDAVADNPSIVRLIQVGSPKAYGLTALAAAVACGLLLWTPRRHVWLLPAVVGLAFAGASTVAAREFAHQSELAESRFAASPRDWIDRGADGRVAYLYDGVSPWQLAWTQLVWNDRLTQVLDLTSERVPGPLPQGQLRLLADDGAFRLVDGDVPETRLVVAPAGVRLDGRALERQRTTGLVLWRLDGPARVATWTQGLLPSGDVAAGEEATLDVYHCRAGRFRLVAVGREHATLTLARDGRTIGRFEIWPRGVWEQTVDTSAGDGKCRFSLSTTRPVHLRAFAWTARQRRATATSQ
jgi:hypothetical protein